MKRAKRIGDIVSIVIMAVLSVILIPILAINLTLIVKGSRDSSVPPDVFGIAPLAVTTGSMSGDRDDSFDEGALIFVRILDEEEKNGLQAGDIVTFRSDGAYVTHRIVSVNRDEAERIVSVVTQGDANNATDGAVPISAVVGQCVGSVEGLGSFSIFLQTPVGILVFVGIPVLLFIVYDVVRISLHNRKVKAENAAEEGEAASRERENELEAARNSLREQEEELRRLRALVGEGGKAEKTDGDQSEKDLPASQNKDLS